MAACQTNNVVTQSLHGHGLAVTPLQSA